MDPLSVAASVAGLLSLGIQVTKSLVDFYSACKSQKSDIAHTAKKLENLLNVLEILRDQLTSREFRADEQALLKTIGGSIQDCGGCIYELQSAADKFRDESADGIRAAARTAARRLAYPFRQSTLQALDEDVDEIVSHLGLAMQVLQQKDIGGVQDDIEVTKALLDLVRASQISSDIRHWLRAPDASINYNEACKKKHPGTGLWLINSSSFSAWLAKCDSFLWLSGFAGCGKSVLCSTAIQHAFRHRRSNPRIGIAFFFFTFNDDSKQDTSAMLRALVLQLSSQLNDNHQLLSRLHDNYCNAMLPDLALLDCLHQLLPSFKDVYILLDALDESPRDKYRGDVLQALVDIRAWKEPNLHLLVTSRDETDIRDELGASRDETIPMKNGSVDEDIAAFISSHLRSARRLRKWEDHHGQIKIALTDGAKGVFRWVECQFAALETCPRSKRRLDGLLASLPRSLDKTYERMLLSIDNESVEDARRILTLLCCAKRPLTVPELIEGIAVELGDDPRLNPNGRLLDNDEICRVCPGFIELDGQANDETATVRIAHYSVQEYLESGRICHPKVTNFNVKMREAHTEVACICLAYLLSIAGVSEEEASEEVLEEDYPLARYAAKNWDGHYHDKHEDTPLIKHLTLRLLRTTGGELDNWTRIRCPLERKYKEAPGKLQSPVYYASYLGLDSALSELLSGKPSDGPFQGLDPSEVSDLVNIQGGYYGSALQAASFGGHEAVVRLLLEKNADVNLRGGQNGNALQAASRWGYIEIVRLLLDKNADVNAQDGFYGNALQAASFGGHEAIVRLLLDKNADINAQDGFYGNALQAASKMGRRAVVKLLLDKDADANAQGGAFGNALQAASEGGHEAVVKLLLDKNADVNAHGGLYGNALQAASRSGHTEMVRLLLDNNADVNIKGGLYGHALQAASVDGHKAVVRLLLARGANGADVRLSSSNSEAHLTAATSYELA